MPGYEPSATSRKASATGTRAACGRAGGAATSATITEKVGAWCSQPAMPPPAPSDGVMIDAARKRTKASRVPSGDHTGQRSESIDGASQRTRRSPRVYSPMKLWSRRNTEKARVLPSGDQASGGLAAVQPSASAPAVRTSVVSGSPGVPSYSLMRMRPPSVVAKVALPCCTARSTCFATSCTLPSQVCRVGHLIVRVSTSVPGSASAAGLVSLGVARVHQTCSPSSVSAPIL